MNVNIEDIIKQAYDQSEMGGSQFPGPFELRVYWDKVNGGFYRNDVHSGETIREGVDSGRFVEISEARWSQLLEEQGSGKVIVTGDDGSPILQVVEPLEPTVDSVKSEAMRRISEVMPSWMVEREVSGGAKINEQIKVYAQNVREASDKLEGFSPIPKDYYDDKYWPTV